VFFCARAHRGHAGAPARAAPPPNLRHGSHDGGKWGAKRIGSLSASRIGTGIRSSGDTRCRVRPPAGWGRTDLLPAMYGPASATRARVTRGPVRSNDGEKSRIASLLAVWTAVATEGDSSSAPRKNAPAKLARTSTRVKSRIHGTCVTRYDSPGNSGRSRDAERESLRRLHRQRNREAGGHDA
jgi:hypothetical protein